MLFIIYSFKKESSLNQQYLSLSPLFSSLTAGNGYHLVAKLLLFSTHLAWIEFIIALLFNYNHILNEAAVKNVVLCIFFALVAGLIWKYVLGSFLNAIC